MHIVVYSLWVEITNQTYIFHLMHDIFYNFLQQQSVAWLELKIQNVLFKQILKTVVLNQ